MGRHNYSFSHLLTEIAHKPLYRYGQTTPITEDDIERVSPGSVRNHRKHQAVSKEIGLQSNVEYESIENLTFTKMDSNSIPFIELVGSNVITIETRRDIYSELGATSNQNSTVSIDSANVDSNTNGTYTVYYTATNKLGISNSLTRTIIVQDTTAPVIRLVGGVRHIMERATPFTEPGATADTGEDVVIDSSNLDANTVGTYIIYYTSTDSSNNVGTAQRSVIVRDTIPPFITLNGDNPFYLEHNIDTYSDPGALANGGEEVVIDSANVSSNILGTYTVYYTSIDSSNNIGSNTRTIITRDTIAPNIFVTSNISGDINIYLEHNVDTYTELGATADGGETVTIYNSNVDSNTLGEYIVFYKASDISENLGSNSRVVTVAYNGCTEIESHYVMGSEISGGYGDRLASLGQTVAISRDGLIVAVSSRRRDYVKVYSYDGSTWSQMGSTLESTPGEFASESGFGASISLSDSGDTIFISSENETTSNTMGRVFSYSDSDWAQVGDTIYYLDRQYIGNRLNNTGISSDGNRVALMGGKRRAVFEYSSDSGNYEKIVDDAIFASTDSPGFTLMTSDGTATLTGDPTYNSNDGVFKYYGSQIYTLVYGQTGYGNETGFSAAITDNALQLYLGEPGYDFGRGRVRIMYRYELNEAWDEWTTIEGENNGDRFGESVSVSGTGDMLVIGAPNHSVVGAVYFYDYNAEDDDYDLFGSYDGSSEKKFSQSLALSKNGRVFVGGSRYDSSTNQNGYIQVYRAGCADTTPPVITLTGNNTVFLEHNIDTYTDLGATADGGETVVVDSANVDANTLGTYTVYYSATDSSNNIGSATRTVITRDTIAPIITLTGNNTVFLEHNIDIYTDLGATADTSETVTVDSANVDANTLGTYTVYYSATDSSNNEGSNTRTVITRDTIAPFITLTGDANLTINQDSTYTDLGATVDTGETVVIDSANVNTNVLGAYTVYYTATDSSNNIGSNTRNVVVSTPFVGQPPIITVGGDDPVYFERNIASTSLFTDLTANVSADGGETITADYGFRVKQPYDYILELELYSNPFAGTYMQIRTRKPEDYIGSAYGIAIKEPTQYMNLTRGESYYFTTISNSYFVRSNTELIFTSSNTATDMSKEGILANILTNNVQYLSNTTAILTIDDDTPDEFWIYDKYNKDLSDTMLGRILPQGSGYVEDSDEFRYSNVNSNLDGTYTITYSATNEYGTNTATRSVDVRDTLAPNIFYYGDQTITVDIADYANAVAEDLTITANTSDGGFFAELSNGALSSNTAMVLDQQLGGEGTLANPIFMDVSDWNYYGQSVPNYFLKRGKTYYIYLGSFEQQIKSFSVISTTKTTNTEYDDKGSKTDYNESKLGFLWTVRGDTPSQLWLRSTVYHYMSNYHVELGIEDDITYTTSNDIVANTAGTYTITYSATDSSNNIGSNTRTLVLTDASPASGIPIITVGGDDPVYFEKNVDSSSLFTDLTANVSADGGETITADYGFKVPPFHKILELHHDGGKMGIKTRPEGAHQYDLYSTSYLRDLSTDGKNLALYRGNTFYFSTAGNAFVQSNSDFILTSSDITTAGLSQESILANTLTNNVQYISNTTMIITVDDDTPDNFWIYDKHNSYFLDPLSTYSLLGRLRAVFSGFSPNSGEAFRYSNVNSNLVGTYTITYSATNEHGTNTATRSVVVRDTSPPGIFYYGDQTITVDIDDYANAVAEDLTITANTSGGGFFAEVSNGALIYNNALVMDHPDTKGIPANPIYMDVSDIAYRGKTIANYHFVRGKTYYVYLGNGALGTHEYISTSKESLNEYNDRGSKTSYNASKLGFLWTVRHDAPTNMWLRSGTHPNNSGSYYLTIKVVDDDSTYTVSNNIVTDTAGTYTITYSATDSSNNATSNTRTLILT